MKRRWPGSSQYRRKLSGVSLFNASRETGQVDNLDVPTVAIPFPPHTELSGEFFAGKGLDVFGGVTHVLVQPADLGQYNSATLPALAGIRMLGGWSHLQVKLNARNEFNLAAGSGARSARGRIQIAQLDPSLQFLSQRTTSCGLRITSLGRALTLCYLLSAEGCGPARSRELLRSLSATRATALRRPRPQRASKFRWSTKAKFGRDYDPKALAPAY